MKVKVRAEITVEISGWQGEGVKDAATYLADHLDGDDWYTHVLYTTEFDIFADNPPRHVTATLRSDRDWWFEEDDAGDSC